MRAGLTQMQVADVLCVSQAAYSRLEKGEVEISLTKLFALSEFYKVSLHKLIEGI
jgi:transcriptional regulator with XRE-family HTH domain